MQYNKIIAFDPDVDRCGVGIRTKEGLALHNLYLWECFDLISRQDRKDTLIVIECSWHTKNASWHKGGKGAARNVGRNQEIGRQLEKFAQVKGFETMLPKPKGYSKVNHKQFIRMVGIDFKKTNPETRVAGLFANNFWQLFGKK